MSMLSSCAPLSPTHSPLPYARLHWRNLVSYVGNRNEPVLRWKRTRMTQIKRIFTDFFIRANPCHPSNPCSVAVSVFEEAPKINRSLFINVWRVKYSSALGATPSNEWCGKIANKRISMTENKKRNKINENI